MGKSGRKGGHLAAGLRPLVDLVYPPRCPLCGEAVVEQGGLCVDCYGELEIPGDPACDLCQRPLGSAAAAKDETCFACRAAPPRHSGIHAATLYDDASRRLLLSFKHGGKIALASLMARLIAVRLPEPAADRAPLLVPVPLHRWRIWQRGYNQSALLARELARQGKGELLVDGLVRRKATRSLGGLGREAREAMLAGAIAVNPARAKRIAGREVILVDDVLTSGATSDACVAALLDGGAREVRVACFARVVDGRGMDGERKPDAPGKGTERKAQEAENTTPEAMKTPGAT
ncbi:ComF family protein [Erythrobacter sp.]|uniref:ComF family protein n=1 Tax=Erythrobacter sp. TaxID=1042 RepID=UPI001425C32F|nr:ComF family protein [Erythrobacter sp.]QIQ86132.1 MAG: ComF family protein [Erythrobacter sp.]